MPYDFRVEKMCGSARLCLMRTDHGEVSTPAFIPVGTQAAVKAASPAVLESVGVQIVLANVYHLFLRPGVETIASGGGLHRFMSWNRPILTDSGGYQVFSLADLGRADEEGITFRSHIDGSEHLFKPESVIEAQALLGADIIMSFDYCTPYPCSRKDAERAVKLTTLWAKRGLGLFGRRFERSGYEQVLFGIVQGSVYPELRRRSLEELLELDFPGYAIGGLSVGEEKKMTWEVTGALTEDLPFDKPRYLMGVGTPLDIVEGVSLGVDLFDCVLPTRNARNGTLFTRFGKMVVKNAAFARDYSPVDEACRCYTCRNFSRAYLRHLFLAGEMLGPILATHHSLHFYCEVMGEVRSAITRGEFLEWKKNFASLYTSGLVDEAKSNR